MFKSLLVFLLFTSIALSCPCDFEEKGGQDVVVHLIGQIKQGNPETAFKVVRFSKYDKIHFGKNSFDAKKLDLPYYIEICNRVQNWCVTDNIFVRINFYVEESK